MTIEFEHENDDGEIVVYEFPSKFEVCHTCNGHGTHLNPSIGEHAYTADEFNEAFFDDEDKEEYFRHGGKYDVTCETCKGKNVISVIDELACNSPELKESLKLYHEKLKTDAEYARECAYERRMGY